MDSNQLKGKWKQIAGAAKSKWGKLTDDDLDRIDGRVDELIGTLQQRYGYARDEAQKQVDDFRSRL